MSDAERIDVLVVGGGLAALSAAIAARGSGARVGLAVKRRAGRSGSSALTTGGYAAVVADAPPGDAIDRHIHDTVVSGAGLGDEALIDILCREGPGSVEELLALGGAFLRRTDGGLHVTGSGDHSAPRSLLAEHRIGVDFTLPLARVARHLGVEVLDLTMVVDLVVADGEVRGAVLLDRGSGELRAVGVGAVVLATGGAGRMFPVTSNPTDVTGDGFSLGLRAGAVLRDMEFIQFYPWRCIDPFDSSRVAVQPETFSYDARMYNADGERFMTAYDPERLEATTRDVSARAIFDQLRRGKGVAGGVRLDLSALTPERLELTNPKIAREMQRSNRDHRTYPFIVAPEAHYFMGGLEIDEHGRTSVAGLYAAGEVTGGVQGANRLSNNSLPEAMIFGRRAGRAAGDAVAGTPAVTSLPEPWRRRSAAVAGRSADPDAAAHLRERRAELRAVVQRSLGIVRTGADLSAGLAALPGLRPDVDAAGTDPDALRLALELRAMCDTAQVCLSAALLRDESRGAHFRDDAPERDEERWRRPIRVWLAGSEADHPLLRLDPGDATGSAPAVAAAATVSIAAATPTPTASTPATSTSTGADT